MNNNVDAFLLMRKYVKDHKIHSWECDVSSIYMYADNSILIQRQIQRELKKENPDCVTVFVSPCVAKRAEGYDHQNVDFVMNYEELGALFVAKKIQIIDLEASKYSIESSKQGRNFGYSGGVAESVKKSLKDEDSVKPCIINGLNKDSIKQLKKYAVDGACEGCNLIEVMCCEGGCIGGNATLNNQKTAKKLIDNFTQNSNDISKI